MPFYEYECQACKFYTEVMQKISDAPLVKCPSCGKRRLKKLVSAPVFRLKGGGWYETDFKSDKESKRNLVGADKEEAPKAEAKDAKDAKPADAKPAAGKPADVKPAEAKSASARAAGSRPAAARTGGPARRPAKSARRKSAPRPRR
ncbi:MAG TPA: zinc ribbon domain-containing protein [Steroidobacteraceae bacterium]|nr:zinc ribbon domain-containing protein [Steroidobacteraceae bacterium]